jgi:hypothetical protein
LLVVVSISRVDAVEIAAAARVPSLSAHFVSMECS